MTSLTCVCFHITVVSADNSLQYSVKSESEEVKLVPTSEVECVLVVYYSRTL